MADETILLSNEYQISVLNLMLHSGEFCNIAREALKPEMFNDRVKQFFFETIANAPIKLTKNTLKEELLKAASRKLIKKDEISAYTDLYKQLQHQPLPEESEYIQTHTAQFIKQQNVKQAILQSFDLAKEGKWDEITDIITKAANSGVDVLSLGHDYFKDWESRAHQRHNEEIGLPLSYGIPDLDDIFNGGLKPGQVSLIAGASGRGKTVFLEWLARTAIILGEQAVYYTYELSAFEIASRFDSLFFRIPPQELKNRHEEIFTKAEQLHNRFGSSLIIKEYYPKQIGVAGLEAHYRQLLNYGIRPGCVIVDYLDLVKAPVYRADSLVEMEETTQALVALAKKFQTRVHTGTQLNRAGMTSATPDFDGLAGSISKIFNVDISIFMAQDDEELTLEEMRLIVKKNRNGKVGLCVPIETNFSIMEFFRARMTQEVVNEENAAS